MALIREHQEWITSVFRAYSFLRRFNLLIDPEIDPELLICMDDEVKMIERLEQEERQRVEDLKRKAKSNAHK